MHEDHNALQLHASGRSGARLPWLIAGVTGRALAASARRGGHRVIVLDYFADRDCAAQAVACRAVCASGHLRFDRAGLLAAARELSPPGGSRGLIYGSGFEGRVDLLRRLATGRPLYGNSPEVVLLLKDPGRFFPLLDRLGIPHPETRATRPPGTSGWLAKRTGGAGGVHVRPARATDSGADIYYQRLTPGRTLSATFLANGSRAVILGFNQQWTTPARPELPYQFGGAVGRLSLPADLRGRIAERLDALVAGTGLVGLNGLDFICERDRWSVLEVNPRPTASMELYDPDFGRGLFDWHVRACQGELPTRLPRRRACRALAIASAPDAWECTGDFVFPRWCRDLPRPGLRFSAGDPVCTVHASAATPREAMRLVTRRKRRIETLLLGTPVTL